MIDIVCGQHHCIDLIYEDIVDFITSCGPHDLTPQGPNESPAASSTDAIVTQQQNKNLNTKL